MIPFDDALDAILANCSPLSTIHVAIEDAAGYFLADSLTTDAAIPAFSKSLVDGFAIKISDEHGGKQILEVVERVTAGEQSDRELNSGSAIRIMTGAPIPAGANAVVMFENVTEISEHQIELDLDSVSKGDLILRESSIAKCNETIRGIGTRIEAWQVGALAENGHSELRVVRQPSIGIMTSGDEVIPHDQTPQGPQIRNSNGPMIFSLASRVSDQVQPIGHVADDAEAIRGTMKMGLQHDVLVITGGVSMGDLDLIPDSLEKLGVKKVFHKINLKPGKPVWFGVFEQDDHRCLVFGLPGNPVSSLVCFELLVKPGILKLAGSTNPQPEWIQAELTADFHNRGNRKLFQASTYCPRSNRITPLPWKGSADQITIANANALAMFEAETKYARGSEVTCVKL